MTTLVPRPPYSKAELDELYPKSLQLQLVQVVSHTNFIRCPSVTALLLSLVVEESHSALTQQLATPSR